MDNVIIANDDKFNVIKKQIVSSGFDKLHIIADFDKTLTRAFTDEEQKDFVPSLISILRDEKLIDEDYSKKATKLFEYYHKIENNEPNYDKRKQAMAEWWGKHFELLIKTGLNKTHFKDVIKSSRVKFRKHTLETLMLLDKQDIPFVILSSDGLGEEAIKDTLEYHKMLFSCVDIVSNKYIWDANGRAIDYVKPYIHLMNKDEHSIKNTPFYSKIKNRKNVILLGDSLSDVNMIKGFEYENVLKVGFLNFDVDKNLERYKQVYDVVITNDSSMKFVYELLKEC